MAVAWSKVEALADEAAARASEVEEAGQLPDDLHERVLEDGFFRIGLPVEVGGWGATPAECFEITRRVAAGDGSVGWVIGAVSSFNLILEAAASTAFKQALFSDPRAYLAGSANGRGTAIPAEGGYEAEGSWGFASGCSGAAWLCGLCNLEPSPGAAPVGLLVMLPADRWEIRKTWDVAGLRGTGSDTVVLTRQHVPTGWTFPLPLPLDHPVTTNSPIACAARGFWPTAYAVAATQLGIARRALDETMCFARAKQRPLDAAPLVEEQAFTRELATAEASWRTASLAAHCELERLWSTAVAGDVIDLDTRVRARLTATHAAQVGASIVRTCFDLAGAGAIGRQHPLARCHRDGTILAFHAAASTRTFDQLGRVLLGQGGDSPFI